MTNSLFDTCAGIFRSSIGITASATTTMDADMAVNEDKKPGLFAQCSFAIIRTAAFSEKDAASVRKMTRHKPLQEAFAANCSRWQPS